MPGALFYARDNTSTVIFSTVLITAAGLAGSHWPRQMKGTRKGARTPQRGGQGVEVRQLADLPTLSGETSAARAQLLQSMRQANGRCIDMLVHAARAELKGTFPLVHHLRDVFRCLTPEVRGRVAHTGVLLVDLQLSNAPWWSRVQAHPAGAARWPHICGSFPRAPAVHLGRAALMLVWHAVRADHASTCLLGVSPEIAQIIGGFSLTELDQVVERQFKYVRPRWEDRPAVWSALILSAQRDDPRRTREVNLRVLQLITGDLLSRPPGVH